MLQHPVQRKTSRFSWGGGGGPKKYFFWTPSFSLGWGSPHLDPPHRNVFACGANLQNKFRLRRIHSKKKFACGASCTSACMCIYVCMYVYSLCMYVCMHRTYVLMFLSIHLSIYLSIYYCTSVMYLIFLSFHQIAIHRYMRTYIHAYEPHISL